MKSGVLLVSACIATAVAAAPLQVVSVSTPYGPIRFHILQLPHEAPDRPCGFAARIENDTSIKWPEATFAAKLIGRDADGNPGTLMVTIRASALYPHGNALRVVPVCGGEPTYLQSVQDVEISLIGGDPDPDYVVSFNAAIAAQKRAAAAEAAEAAREKVIAAAAQKRAAAAAAAAAARQRALAAMPVVSSGAVKAFVGSDQKCAEQSKQALEMDGLEARKRMADLVTYGCGVLVRNPFHVTVTQRRERYLQVTIQDGDHAGTSGWIQASWLKEATVPRSPTRI